MKYFTLVLMAVAFGACGKSEDPTVTTIGGAEHTVTNTVYQDPPLNDPQFIVPCKKDVTHVPQMIVFSSGKFFSVTGNVGDSTTFTLLAPGNYTTTDGRNCQFTITIDGYVE